MFILCLLKPGKVIVLAGFKLLMVGKYTDTDWSITLPQRYYILIHHTYYILKNCVDLNMKHFNSVTHLK